MLASNHKRLCPGTFPGVYFKTVINVLAARVSQEDNRVKGFLFLLGIHTLDFRFARFKKLGGYRLCY
jgi:hypothetical protein